MGTFTIAPKADGTVKAYAILRFAGDKLDPLEISDILGIDPTRAYRKREKYFAGLRAGMVTGRTGIWLLSTDEVVSGSDLDRHISCLLELIFEDGADRFSRLHQLIADGGLQAHVSCFWHGKAGAQAPEIPTLAIEGFKRLPAEIEIDFDAD